MNSRFSPLILLLLIPGSVTLDRLSVTCNQKSICAVKGSEVTLKCSYSNINIKTVFWFSEKQSTSWRKNNEPEDLTLDSDSGRVKHQISNSSSTLTISDVRERDSGEYQLMFIMNDGVKHLRSAAVSLTVTDLQLRMNPVSTDTTDERVQLTCYTCCTLTSGGHYYWMKDGQYFRQTQSPDIFVSISSDAGGFSCSRDQNLKHPSSSVCVSQSGCWDVTYTSRRVCALIKRSPAAVSEGQEVILSCLTKCTLNDKHTYIWYKNRRQVTDGFTKVNKLYLDSVSNEELQQYSCAVGDAVNSTVFSHYTVTLLLFLTQFLIIAALWMWSISSVSFIVCEFTQSEDHELQTLSADPAAAHSRENMDFRLLLILLLHFPGSLTLNLLNVTCGQQSICAVKGSEVTLTCFSSNINIKTVFWFSKKQSETWRKNNEPEDLTLDSDYSGRVKHQISSSSSTLTISDVKERDSGEYQLMFIMNDGVKHLRSAAVSLTVTDLHVRMNTASTYLTDDTVKLTCDTSCDLTFGPVYYYWLKHGQYFTYTDSPNMFVSISRDAGSFSCSHEDLKHCASSVCVSQSVCWVIHPSDHTVNKTFWHYGPTDGQSGIFSDLREEHQFAGHVEYVGNKLRIKELKISDSGEYRFIIITDLNQYSGSPGVILTVTDPVNSTVFSHYTVTLLVFLPQFLIIAALWMWYFIKIPFKSQTENKYDEGTEVTLMCFYSNINIKTVFWFSEKQSTNWKKNNEPEDLILDSDYSGRVKHQISNSSSTLTISDVRERDSGEYQLMFIINDGVKHLRSAAVSLTVTVLEVRMNPVSTNLTDERVELTCDTSCTLTSGVRYYYWIKNGQYSTYTNSPNMFVSISRDAGSFSCSHKDLKHRSSSVCVSQSVCWDVTYTSTRVCALVNSTVDISCTYSHPSGHTVNKTFWHYGPSWDFKDLREEHQFAGRVEYVGNKLRIKDLKISDSGEYRFRFITDKTNGKFSGTYGVILTVTGDKQPRRSVRRKLCCLTKCTLNEKYTYIWYKNGRQVTDGFTKVNKLYLDSVSNEELQQYSCAVGDAVNSTVFSHYTVTLLLFLPQFLIIAALWMWFFIKTSFKNQTENKNEEMSSSTSAVRPSELLE
ncbi:sialoadhesin-like isoform X1 [Labeo rohita]|uniref:Sialoadhesin-like isoform X1 n=1 Tax=Labeo rohita TaxID=84645 RepID=A0A498MB92_LABRO|nr:sialoadhesin-like isoform X1 [Labeo rohita]